MDTEESQVGFLEAVRACFGSYRAGIDHFRASSFREARVPGTPLLHQETATHLEEAVGGLPEGTAAPRHSCAFGLRLSVRNFPSTAGFMFSASDMHPLGYAIDYFPRLNPDIRGPREAPEHLADRSTVVRAVTGEANYFDLGPTQDRLDLTREMAEQGCAIPSPEQQALLDRVLEESDRLNAASDEFRQSLGEGTAVFLELRTLYFEAESETDRADVLARVAQVIGPWTAAVQREEDRLAELAGRAGFELAALPTDRELQHLIRDLEETRSNAEDARDTLVAATDALEGWESELGLSPGESVEDRLRAVAEQSGQHSVQRAARHHLRDVEAALQPLPGWESELALSGGGAASARTEAVGAAATERIALLQPLAGLGVRATRLASARAELEDPTFLFGRQTAGADGRPTTESVVRAPSMAQLVEMGFYNSDEEQDAVFQGALARNRDDRANRPMDAYNAAFLQALVRSGFTLGLAWGDEGPDAMHVELAVPVPSRTRVTAAIQTNLAPAPDTVADTDGGPSPRGSSAGH